MLANDYLSDLEEKLLFDDSSCSSISETFSSLDIKSSGNQTNEKWEAIEKTLYEESGEHVTDPNLLKECKLWRETFPHFRVRGTKIDLPKPQIIERREETDKSIQTIQGHVNLSKIQKKRESIKAKVVDEIVDRLIAKFKLKKQLDFDNVEMIDEENKSGVVITEINSDRSVLSALSKKSLLPTYNTSLEKKNGENDTPELPSSLDAEEKNETFFSNTDRESYYERGKDTKDPNNSNKEFNFDNINERLYEIFDSWDMGFEKSETPITNEKQLKKAEEAEKTKGFVRRICDFSNFEVIPPTGETIGLKPTKKIKKEKSKTDRMHTRSNDTIKPFEITTKIDKKYEGLLNKILEKKSHGLEPMKHCHNTHLTADNYENDFRSCQEYLEKLRIQSGFEDVYKQSNYYNSNTNLPRINKFSNNWLERGIIHARDTAVSDMLRLKSLRDQKISNRISKIQSEISEADSSPVNFDAKFIRDLKKEIGFKRLPMKSEAIDKISLNRPKPLLPPGINKNTLKSSSCGDLPHRNKRNSQTSRKLKSGIDNVEKETIVRSRVRFTSLNNKVKQNRFSGNKNAVLPPIETGIICKELTGRPKIGPKNPSKPR